MKKTYSLNKIRHQRTFFFWCFALSCFIFSCEDNLEREPENWKAPSSDEFALYPIVYNKKVILSSKCGNLNCLKAFKLKTGEPLWQWVDHENILRKSYYNLKHYVFEGILVLPIASDLLAIDLIHGKTLWNFVSKWSGESFIEGLGPTIVRSYNDKDSRKIRVLSFDIYSGQSKEIKTFNKSPIAKKFVRTPLVVKKTESHDTICITSIINYIPSKITTNQLIFWNINDTSTQKEIKIYPDNQKGDGVTQQAILYDSNSYWVANNQVICINIETQLEIWRTKLPRGMLTSRLFVDENIVYFACENEVLYALKAEDGSILWKCNISGTPGRIHINKDKLYLVGGSDGNLYVIDKIKGKLLFKHQATDFGLLKKDFFERTSYAGSDMLILKSSDNWFIHKIIQNGDISR